MPNMGRPWTPQLVARRLRDTRATIETYKKMIRRDPTSVNVPTWERKMSELADAALIYQTELEMMGVTFPSED